MLLIQKFVLRMNLVCAMDSVYVGSMYASRVKGVADNYWPWPMSLLHLILGMEQLSIEFSPFDSIGHHRL